MPLQVSCQCGKSFQAPDTLAGKQVKCPNCGAPLSIPAVEETGHLFDDLSDLQAAAEQASVSSTSDIGHAAASVGLGPTPLQTHRGTGGIPTAAIVAGGVVGLLLLALVILLVVGGGGDEEQRPNIAQGDSSDSNETGGSSGSGNGGDPAGGTSDRDESPGDSNAPPDRGQNGGGGLMQGLSNILSSVTGGGGGSDKDGGGGTNAAPPKSDLVHEKMAPGLMTWYGGGKLESTRTASESEMLELHYGWMVSVLPHMGYQDLYDKFDFEKPYYEGENERHTQQVIPEFLNPADDHKLYKGYRYEGMALSHFVGVSGVEDGRNVVAATLARSDPRAGIFGYHDIAKMRDIKDGTSRTIMMIGSGELACPWVQSGGSTIRGAREPYFADLTGFGSKGGPGGHGAIAVMADGSVQWIKADVDPKVFRAMCTIAGGDFDQKQASSYDASSYFTSPLQLPTRGQDNRR